MDDRVLLVEDDPSIREVASLGLRGAGLSVEAAADGRDGLVRFRAEPALMVDHRDVVERADEPAHAVGLKVSGIRYE